MLLVKLQSESINVVAVLLSVSLCRTFDSSDWAVVSSSCSSPLECLSSCLPTISTCVSNMATEVECGEYEWYNIILYSIMKTFEF